MGDNVDVKSVVVLGVRGNVDVKSVVVLDDVDVIGTVDGTSVVVVDGVVLSGFSCSTHPSSHCLVIHPEIRAKLTHTCGQVCMVLCVCS